MSNENQKPKPWDAVLGGQNLPKVYDAVLGGIKQITTHQAESIPIENEKKLNKEENEKELKQKDLSENKVQDSKYLRPDTDPSNSNTVENANPANTSDNDASAGCGCLTILLIYGLLAVFDPFDLARELEITGNIVALFFAYIVTSIMILVMLLVFIIILIWRSGNEK